jgi:hypothetical protein
MKGVCHLCRLLPQEPPIVEIEYCSMCGHWFCEDCKTVTWKHVWDRGLEAVKEKLAWLVGVPRGESCCGPRPATEERHAQSV